MSSAALCHACHLFQSRLPAYTTLANVYLSHSTYFMCIDLRNPYNSPINRPISYYQPHVSDETLNRREGKGFSRCHTAGARWSQDLNLELCPRVWLSVWSSVHLTRQGIDAELPEARVLPGLRGCPLGLLPALSPCAAQGRPVLTAALTTCYPSGLRALAKLALQGSSLISAIHSARYRSC